MLHILKKWLGINTVEETKPVFKRMAVYRIEKAYLNYKSSQRIQKNLDSNIEFYKSLICKNSKIRINHNNKR